MDELPCSVPCYLYEIILCISGTLFSSTTWCLSHVGHPVIQFINCYQKWNRLSCWPCFRTTMLLTCNFGYWAEFGCRLSLSWSPSFLAYTTNSITEVQGRRELKGSVKEPNKFTTMKLRKSLVKPVTWQNISSCLVLPTKIVMHDAFNVILWTSADICVVHDDLGWKNRTTWYNCRFSATSLALRVIFVCWKRPLIYTSCMTISGGRTEQHVIICFGELAESIRICRHSLSILTA